MRRGGGAAGKFSKEAMFNWTSEEGESDERELGGRKEDILDTGNKLYKVQGQERK